MYSKLKQTLKSLPKTAGVYQFFDIHGKLLYIGKAKRLHARVKSYFKFTPTLQPATNLSLRIKNMISKTSHLEYIQVDSEHDAFILENSLIKQLKPKYNILMRDDKTYPYIFINLDDDFPRFEITRKVVKGKNIRYFGPFSTGAKEILEALYLLFPLVQKKGCLREKKACLFYQIKRCYAPCEGKISTNEYKKIVKEAIQNIHQRKPLLNLLHVKMETYSNNQNYEKAAQIRDMKRSIEAIKDESYMDLARLENFDLFAIHVTQKVACAMRFFIREGKIVSTSHSLVHSSNGFDTEALYRQMILSFYAKESPMPINKVYIAQDIEDKEQLAQILTSWHHKKVAIVHPKRGEKLKLTSLALLNAKELIQRDKQSLITKTQKEIQEFFELESFPFSIETFDNSHLSGSATVGAIIAWEGDSFNKTKYRHYHLHSKDEYSQMSEILTNRAQRFDKEPPPDLWIIDGGKTLLSLAKEIAISSGANLDIIAISKEKIDAKSNRAKGGAKDIIHTLQRSYNLPPTDTRLMFIQKLRDEAHRFAITFHRKTKLKLDKQSSSLQKAGLSEAKIKKLLLYFGTFEAIKKASKSDLERIIGQKSTLNMLKSFNDEY